MNADEKVRRYRTLLVLCMTGLFIGNELGIGPTITTAGVICIIMLALAIGYHKSGDNHE